MAGAAGNPVGPLIRHRRTPLNAGTLAPITVKCRANWNETMDVGLTRYGTHRKQKLDVR